LPSGSIIFVIVALWAAVLVPALLRRHDEATENKSVDRFTRAMRTLRRDNPLPGDDHTVLMPRRPVDSVAPQLFSKSDGVVAVAARLRRRRRAVSARVSAPAATPAPSARRPGSSSAARPAARRPVSSSLIARRRRALRTIGIAAAVTFLGGLVLGGLAWALHGLIDGLAAVYVVHLRSEAKRSRALARRRPARPRVPEAMPRRSYERYAAAGAAEQPIAAPQGGWEGEQRHVSFDDGMADPAAASASAGGSVEAGETSRAWQPIPVPPPTYVTAPKAPRRGKQIDVPSSWVDGLRDDGADVDLTALERPEPEIERLLERRRAVND
jgi:hypothetical protein